MAILEWAFIAHTCAALLLALYAAHQAVLLGLYLFRRNQRGPDVPPVDAAGATGATWPSLTVQLPLYNERYLAQRVIAAVAAQTYPRDRLRIQVLDDSTDDTQQIARAAAAEARARGVAIEVLHRPDRAGFKAGALQAGLAANDSELLAIFDADFAPDPDFLRRVVARWRALDAQTGGTNIGFVQTRWDYANRDASVVTRGQALALDVHFVIEQLARDRSGLPLAFNGSGGIWRRACIDAAGGWQSDTLTEDLDLSYRARLRGWRGCYFEDDGAPGDLPRDVLSYKRQQARWSRGTMQTVRKLAARMWRSRWPLAHKLAGTLHLTGYVIHPLILLMALTTPLLLLHTLAAPASVVSRWINAVSILSVAPMISMYVAAAARRRSLGSFVRDLPGGLLLGVGVCLSNTLSMARGLLSRDPGEFARTPKTLDAESHAYRLRPDRTLWLEIALALYSACAMIAGWAYGARLDNPLAALPLALYALSFGGVAAGQIRALIRGDQHIHGTSTA